MFKSQIGFDEWNIQLKKKSHQETKIINPFGVILSPALSVKIVQVFL